jgi:hypothetical protein
MKWRVRKPMTRHRALHWWHVWFAWHPVRVPTRGKGRGQTMVWLGYVRRKGCFCMDWGDSVWDWEYKEFAKNAKNTS